MLQVTREQRRGLIEGDLKGVEQSNRLLGALLDSQQALHREGPPPHESADHKTIAYLRELAQQLQRESRTNYLLACRGAEFTRFSLSLLMESVAPEHAQAAAASPAAPRVLDRPA
jgi:hypothetical protein